MRMKRIAIAENYVKVHVQYIVMWFNGTEWNMQMEYAKTLRSCNCNVV